MLYFLHMPRKFWKSAYNELKGICSFRIIESLWDNVIIDAEAGLLKKLNSKGNIFIYGAFAINRSSAIDKNKYIDSIYAQVKKEAEHAKGSMIIEAYDINSKSEYSAKSLEVLLGNRLEKEGFAIDLKNPTTLICTVLFNWKCYSGSCNYSANARKTLNPIRHYNLSRNMISRSEMKIAEAFDRFGIKAKGTAIDLGAAPGGWSGFLAKKGFSVIAVDNAAMDSGKIVNAGIKLASDGKSKKPAKGAIMHYRMGFAAAFPKLKGMKADLLVNDMNVSPADSAKAIVMFSSLLKSRGICIMTMKSITRNVKKHEASVRKEIKGIFSIERIAVLPSNRQELTLLCRKR